MQQYYDDEGNLTQATAIQYPAMPLPDASSLSDTTVCPNQFAFGGEHGVTFAQMMIGPKAQTSWKPIGENGQLAPERRPELS